MPRTVFLHIGLPKTGSTFLQKRVFPQLSHLKVISMPRNEHFRESGTRLLGSVFSRSDTIWLHYADQIFEALLQPGWQSDQRDILISDEVIGRSTSRQALCAGHLAGMKSALKDRGIERFKLLFFVRRQDEWLASHYAQVSDRREKPGQRDFENLAARITDPHEERFTFGALLDYAATYSAISSAVGNDNVKVLPMEWLESNLSVLSRELADWLDLPSEAIELGSHRVENKRNTGRGIWKLRDRSWRSKTRRILLRQDFCNKAAYGAVTGDIGGISPI